MMCRTCLSELLLYLEFGSHNPHYLNKSNNNFYIIPSASLFIHTPSGRIGKVVPAHAAVARSIPAEVALIYYARGDQGLLPMRVGGATSQLDLPSLMPLSVAGCG